MHYRVNFHLAVTFTFHNSDWNGYVIKIVKNQSVVKAKSIISKTPWSKFAEVVLNTIGNSCCVRYVNGSTITSLMSWMYASSG